MAETTSDKFLGGRLILQQPASGYRAGVDPVFLAASVPARSGQRVLDLGCGVGTAMLCLGARVPGLSLTGVELQSDYADLARQNAQANETRATVETDDLFAPQGDWARESFDIVMTNPPYFEADSRTPSPKDARETGLAEVHPLEDWLDTAIRRLSPKGTLAVIQRADRLDALLSGLKGRVGGIEVRPLAARSERPAKLVIVTARKGAKAALILHSHTILHLGDTHTQDGESYRPEVNAVLRDGAPWPWVSV